MAAIVKGAIGLKALLRTTLVQSPLLASLLGLASTPTPVLRVLSLSNSAVDEGAAEGTVIGTLSNLTAGSTRELTDDAGGLFALSGSSIVTTSTPTDYETATSHSITVTETLTGATGSPKDTVLTIGVVNLNDTNPSAFTFTDVASAALSALETSNTITVVGLGASDTATASISGAASSEMQVNGGTWGPGPATVANGDTIGVRHTSSDVSGGVVNTTLTIGTTTDTFTSVTDASAVVYDDAIGNGVDSAGFADLPLRTVATDGSDLATGAPTLGANTTYDAPSRTITTTFLSGAFARWDDALVIGEQYRFRGAYQIDSSCGIDLRDENGATQAVFEPGIGFNGLKGYRDIVFTATGTDLVLVPTNDGFAGTFTVQALTANSGGVDAHRFFVDPVNGDDSHNGIEAQDPSTPVASITEAAKFLHAGLGDQILVAQGSTFTTMPSWMNKSGYSALYPTVCQTYDITDATNEALYGRATGADRVTITDIVNSATLGEGTLNYLAIRGFDFNPGEVPTISWGFLGNSTAPHDYILLENNRYIYAALSIDMSPSPTQSQKIIVRNCANYGAYTTTEGQRPSNIFFNQVKFTYEDSVNVHAGWKPGASRDDLIEDGGLVSSTAGPIGYFMHPFYQTAESDGVARRLLITDGAGDSGSWRGDIEQTNCLIMDCPTAFAYSSGDNQDTKRPLGRMITSYGNAAIGVINTSTDLPNGRAFYTDNGQAGSEVYDNLAVRGTPSSSNALSYANDALFNQPSYVNYHGNIAYGINDSGKSYYDNGSTPYPAQVHTTWGSNWSDDPTGSPAGKNNISNTELTFPNAYADSDALAVAQGYTNKQAFVDYAVAHPEEHIQRAALVALRAGYGMVADTTAPTLSLPTGVATSDTEATVGATTDEPGTVYYVITASSTAPTEDQVKAHEDETGSAAVAFGSAFVSTGAFTENVTGLTAGEGYYAHLMEEDASGNQSNVVTSALFTTDSGSTATTFDPATSSAGGWSFSPGDLTAQRLFANFTDHLFGTTLKSAGSWTLTADVFTGGDLCVGFNTGGASSTTGKLGFDAGYSAGYMNNGDIYFNNALVSNGNETFTQADDITATITSTTVSFYKNGVLQDTATITGSPLAAGGYACASHGSFAGDFTGTGNFTDWDA